jgi:hypothetical protein
MPDGFYAEQIDNITIHRFTNSAESAIDAWGVELARTIDDTPDDQLFRVLLDVSSPQVSFSRHARQTSQRLFTRYRGRHGRLAFLFSSKTAPHFARLFLASLGRLEFELQFFSNREKAMNWLQGS